MIETIETALFLMAVVFAVLFFLSLFVKFISYVLQKIGLAIHAEKPNTKS